MNTDTPNQKNINCRRSCSSYNACTLTSSAEEHIKLNVKIQSGTTLKPLAVLLGQTAVVEALSQCSTHCPIQPKDRCSPLYHASNKGNFKQVKILQGLGMDPNQTDERGWTALICASARGYADIAEFLCSHGADIEMTETLSGMAAVHYAARNGHLPTVKALHCGGGPTQINLPTKSGHTPLLLASTSGSFKIVHYLTQNGADVCAASKFGVTPVGAASRKGHLQIVTHLCKLGADVNRAQKDGSTPLMLAAHCGYLDVVQCLAKYGADIDATDEEGQTAIALASSGGHADVVNFLREVGADMNKCDEVGRSPLLVALEGGHYDVMECLCKAGANLDTQVKNGETALFKACMLQDRRAIELLVRHGANPSLGSEEISLPTFQGLLER